MIQHQALHVAILGHQGDALIDGVTPGSSAAIALPSISIVAALDRSQAEDGLQNLGAPAADQPGEPVDLALQDG